MSSYKGHYIVEVDTGGKVMFPGKDVIADILQKSSRLKGLTITVELIKSSVVEQKIKELADAILSEINTKVYDSASDHEYKYHSDREY